MIRGIDNKGCVILGITRREIVGLLEGQRCCFPADVPRAPGPHICLWFAEDDDGLLAKLDEMYPDGKPSAVLDLRTKRGVPDFIVCYHDGCENEQIDGSDYCAEHQG